MKTTRKCSKCGTVIDSLQALRQHYNEQHGGYTPKSYKKQVSAFDTILEAEKMLKQAVQQLDAERNELSERLLVLDDKISKYRKLT